MQVRFLLGPPFDSVPHAGGFAVISRGEYTLSVHEHPVPLKGGQNLSINWIAVVVSPLGFEELSFQFSDWTRSIACLGHEPHPFAEVSAAREAHDLPHEVVVCSDGGGWRRSAHSVCVAPL